MRPFNAPSPVPGQTCQNCPAFAGIDPGNISSGMGTCRFEPAKILGGGGGNVVVQHTPTHPTWWCMQHPLISAMMKIKYEEVASRLLLEFNQQQMNSFAEQLRKNEPSND